MKVEKLIKETKDFFSGKTKEKKNKSKKLEKIIVQLKSNRDKLKKATRKEMGKKKKTAISDEYKAVVKLLHKARKRYEKLQ